MSDPQPITVNDFVCAVGEMTNADALQRVKELVLMADDAERSTGAVPSVSQPAECHEPTEGEPLTLTAFSVANSKRCEDPQGFNHAIQSWSTSDWFVAVMGELGEAANVVKKLNRYRDGVRGNKESEPVLRAKLRGELADAFIYLDLIFQACGFVTADAVVDTFDAKSSEIGYPHKLRVVPSVSPAPQEQNDVGPVAKGWRQTAGFPRQGVQPPTQAELTPDLSQLIAGVKRVAAEMREQGRRGLGDYYADADCQDMITWADELEALLSQTRA